MRDYFKEQLTPEKYEQYIKERDEKFAPMLEDRAAIERGEKPSELEVYIQAKIVNVMYDLHLKYGIKWEGW